MILKIKRFLRLLDRRFKQIILIILDVVLIEISLIISLLLKHNNLTLFFYPEYNLFLITIPFFVIPLSINLGLYKSVLQYIGINTIIAAIKSVTIASLLVFSIFTSFKIPIYSFQLICIFWFVSICSIVLLRYLSYNFLYPQKMGTVVSIYGAGEAGIQLSESLSKKYNLVCFFDEDPKKNGVIIKSKKVLAAYKIREKIKKYKIQIIFIAIPSLSSNRRKEIYSDLVKLPVKVMTLPSLDKIIDGKISLDQVKEVNVEDIIGREIIKPDQNLLEHNIKNNNILITGGGGSIGSELCRQIFKLKPSAIIIMDNSEFNLYKIDSELKSKNKNVLISSVLGSIQNIKHLHEIFIKYKVDVVFHTAAFKHVPILEKNIYSAVINNIFGTYNVVKVSEEYKVKNFILVSSDKAVNPTSIMGATKRFSELILQAKNECKSNSVKFSIVRFGNVLDSAGSVLPLFRQQIKYGGPVTVTHKNIVRYFMSIPEAVQLVIQSSTLATGGDVFVLDMGKPINIYDMAKKMIHLSGYIPYEESNENGDIKIQITGLRPGEKLFEELTLNDEIEKTVHPKIMKVNEPFISLEIIENGLKELKEALANKEKQNLLPIINKYVKSSYLNEKK
tara:strand:+ start:5201 stop:7054 length:1854 start_codon:yes stop_codon:yes gene_type:complete